MTADPAPTLVDTPRGPVELFLGAGTGPAVLALHGAMGGWDQSLLLAETLADPAYRIIAMSRPGYLGTPLAAGRTPEEQADLYAMLLDALGVPEVAVMAVSGGGPSAIHFALRHPHRCWGLVLVSTVATTTDNRLPLAFHVLRLAARWPWLMRRMRPRGGGDVARAAAASIPDPEMRARTLADPEAGPLLRRLLSSTSEDMARRMAGTLNDVDITRTRDYPLEEIRVPTLVVHGTDDRIVPFRRHGEALATRIRGAELALAEGGDHVSIFTHHGLLKPQVVRFLQAHAPATCC
jgi:pimeloyl-ACP methyl ester carboxylesterase